jgi:hypothetical protein
MLANGYGLALSATSDAAHDAYVTCVAPSCPSHSPMPLVGSDRSVLAYPCPQARPEIIFLTLRS